MSAWLFQRTPYFRATLVYLVSGHTNGERNVYRSDHRPKSGRWLQRKHTPHFRASAGNDFLCRRDLRLHSKPRFFTLATVVKCDDRLIWGSVSLPHWYRAVHITVAIWTPLEPKSIAEPIFRWESKLDPHLRNKRGLKESSFRWPPKSKGLEIRPYKQRWGGNLPPQKDWTKQ